MNIIQIAIKIIVLLALIISLLFGVHYTINSGYKKDEDHTTPDDTRRSGILLLLGTLYLLMQWTL